MTGGVRWSRAVGGYVGLAAMGAVLLRAGGGSLTVPLDSGDELMWWLDATSPPVIATAILRLVALAACGYLIVALTVAVVAGLAPHRRLGLLLGRLAPATVRRAVIYGARSGLATTVALGSLGSLTASPSGATPTTFHTLTPEADPPPHVVTMSKLTPGVPSHPVRPANAGGSTAPVGPRATSTSSAGANESSDPSTTTGVSSAGGSEPSPSTATMIHLGPAAGSATEPPSDPSMPTTPTSPPGTTTRATRTPGPASTAPHSTSPPTTPPTSTSTSGGAPTSVPSPRQPDPSRPPATTEPSPADDEWVVGPGDSFWSIAEEALRDARAGTQPEDAEISRYWKALIAANRTRLTAPDNPDLLHVGQALILPPPN